MTSAPVRDPLADHLITPQNAALRTWPERFLGINGRAIYPSLPTCDIVTAGIWPRRPKAWQRWGG